MAYHKRRIVEVFFPLKNEDKLHPAVILSIPKVYYQDDFYICAMITSSDTQDQFSFPLSDSDTTKPFSKSSQIRLHLIAQIFEKDINKDMPINELSTDCFERLIDHIEEKVFDIPFYLES